MRHMAMRGIAWIATFMVMLAGGEPACAEAAANWHLDRVAVVMRHGIRPPTRAEPLPAVPHQPWPAWDVGWGELTHHGEQAIARLAGFDARTYAPLLGSGCPAPGTVRAVADTDQRTMRTAEVYVQAMFAGCAVPVEHKAPGEIDPRFSPFDGGPLMSVDETLAAARSALPPGGTAALDRQLAPRLHLLDGIIACGQSGGSASCALAGRPVTLAVPNGSVKLGGGLGMGASLAETLALEYAEGKPLAEVGWGRADRQTITALLALHTQEFALTARPLAIARAGSAQLLGAVASALSDPGGPRFSLFLGHDTNLALIGGALGLHWHAPQFAPDDPPPGGALMFERWSDGAGHYRLAIRFRSQSLDEMRNLSAMAANDATPVAFAPCSGPQICTDAELRAALTGN